MTVKVQVSGVDIIPAGPKRQSPMPYAFGLEASPATCSQVFKVPLNGVPVRPGDTIQVSVKGIGEAKGALWCRGDVSVVGGVDITKK